MYTYDVDFAYGYDKVVVVYKRAGTFFWRIWVIETIGL